MNIRTVIEWAPRKGNEEADTLGNGDHATFDPALRSPVNANGLNWVILLEALAAGQRAENRF